MWKKAIHIHVQLTILNLQSNANMLKGHDVWLLHKSNYIFCPFDLNVCILHAILYGTEYITELHAKNVVMCNMHTWNTSERQVLFYRLILEMQT